MQLIPSSRVGKAVLAELTQGNRRPCICTLNNQALGTQTQLCLDLYLKPDRVGAALQPGVPAGRQCCRAPTPSHRLPPGLRSACPAIDNASHAAL